MLVSTVSACGSCQKVAGKGGRKRPLLGNSEGIGRPARGPPGNWAAGSPGFEDPRLHEGGRTMKTAAADGSAAGLSQGWLRARV